MLKARGHNFQVRRARGCVKQVLFYGESGGDRYDIGVRGF